MRIMTVICINDTAVFSDDRDLIYILDSIIHGVFDKEAFYVQLLTRPTGWTQRKLPLNLNYQQFCFSHSHSIK